MESIDIAVIGGGPAGLRAAEVAANLGRQVTIFEAKPSVGRKFLVAGKGGLNITHAGSVAEFTKQYEGGSAWHDLLSDFDSQALRQWCHDLGQETFLASSGRVYPKSLKGAPLLRAWLGRLKGLSVEIRPRHSWQSMRANKILRFSNGLEVKAHAIIFALGGASWPKTGSDGAWVDSFHHLTIQSTPLQSSNCGWECSWPVEVLEAAEGLPIKNIQVSSADRTVAGELLLTKYGLEGGAIYALGSCLRRQEQAFIEIDFKPTFSQEALIKKVELSKGDFFKQAVRSWKLSKPAVAILKTKEFTDLHQLASFTKACRIELTRPRSISEAISSAGGVSWEEIDSNLMLKKYPGIYLCGEMIDWDAPTGGYLLQAAFSTGTRAGKSAANYQI